MHTTTIRRSHPRTARHSRLESPRTGLFAGFRASHGGALGAREDAPSDVLESAAYPHQKKFHRHERKALTNLHAAGRSIHRETTANTIFYARP